jgi:hypothetical protein
MVVFVGLVTAMTWTQLLSTAPPKLVIVWVVVSLVFSAIALALDYERSRQAVAG